jgi:organic hydroperoxide reductase OsmC/OhrA
MAGIDFFIPYDQSPKNVGLRWLKGACMTDTHDYTVQIVWTGDRGDGTRTYRGYDRTWQIDRAGEPPIKCSNDPLLGGDPAKPNPETLLLSSLAACHMLWFLHLASDVGIVVHGYKDAPIGIGESGPHGEGRFLRAVLRPKITVERGADLVTADALHHEIHKYCFIARSVNFPVTCDASYVEV